MVDPSFHRGDANLKEGGAMFSQKLHENEDNSANAFSLKKVAYATSEQY